MTNSNALDRLRLPRFPRSSAYAPEWIVANEMGPHPLWLVESLTELVPIEAGMRVLDLGCGTAMTSIFLAREFGARVFAADLWVEPTENWVRVTDAGVQDRVTPLRMEAHDIPFAERFFDVIVSVDAYHYFGTDDLFLSWGLLPYLKDGGRLAIVVPGFREEPVAVPRGLQPYWEPDFWTFHSPSWWRRHWERPGGITVDVADLFPGGRDLWKRWNATLRELRGASRGQDSEVDVLDLLDADVTESLVLCRVVGTKQ